MDEWTDEWMTVIETIHRTGNIPCEGCYYILKMLSSGLKMMGNLERLTGKKILHVKIKITYDRKTHLDIVTGRARKRQKVRDSDRHIQTYR